jgi:ATP-dependent Clp protease ATP-binding subunit ClpA
MIIGRVIGVFDYPHHRRLSELARRVIRAAEMWAAHNGDDSAVQPAHLMLALVLETRSPAAALMRASGIDLTRVQIALAMDSAVGIDPALHEAYVHAERLGSHYIGSEHLLLALTTQSDAAAVLIEIGIDLDDLRTRVERYFIS